MRPLGTLGGATFSFPTCESSAAITLFSSSLSLLFPFGSSEHSELLPVLPTSRPHDALGYLVIVTCRSVCEGVGGLVLIIVFAIRLHGAFRFLIHCLVLVESYPMRAWVRP